MSKTCCYTNNFICKPISITVANAQTRFTSGYQGQREIVMTQGNADGNYYADEETLKRIEGEGQVVFRYVDNPNGSVGDIAGLRDYFAMGTRIMEGRVGTDLPVDAALMVRVSFAAVLANVMFKDWLFPKGMATDAAIRDAVIEFVIDGIRANEVGQN